MQQALLPIANLFAVGSEQFTFEQFDFFFYVTLRHLEFTFSVWCTSVGQVL